MDPEQPECMPVISKEDRDRQEMLEKEAIERQSEVNKPAVDKQAEQDLKAVEVESHAQTQEVEQNQEVEIQSVSMKSVSSNDTVEAEAEQGEMKRKKLVVKTHQMRKSIKALREQTVSKKKLEQVRDLELQMQSNAQKVDSDSDEGVEDIIFDEKKNPVDVGGNMGVSQLVRKFMDEGIYCEDGKIIKMNGKAGGVNVPRHGEGSLWVNTNRLGQEVQTLSGVQCAKTRG
jgi:hypothetical protein